MTVHGFADFMIENLRAAGYTTALYGECLNDAPDNWYRNSSTGKSYNGLKAVSLGISASSTSGSATASASPSGRSTTSNVTVPSPTAVEGGEGQEMAPGTQQAVGQAQQAVGQEAGSQEPQGALARARGYF
jgi:hypothetical protein